MNYTTAGWAPNIYLHPEHRLGLTAGGYVSFYLDPKFCLRAEFCWSEKGTSASYSLLTVDSASGLDMLQVYDTKLELSYLEIPLWLNLVLRREDNELGTLGIGPYWAWLGRGSLTTSLETFTNSFSYRQEYRLEKDDLKRADFGLAAGLSAYFYNFEVNIRYSMGLRPLFHQDFDDINRFLDPTNRVWSLSVGYQIK